jgi:hypothetical protein
MVLHGAFLGAQRKARPPLFPAKIEWLAEVSIQLETFDRARHRQELRRYTDLELILSG